MEKLTILIAESNPFFFSVLKSHLTEWGYNSVFANGGLEALDILQTESIAETPFTTGVIKSVRQL